MRVIGVDPGAFGAIALIEGARIIDLADMPILSIRRGKTDKAEVDGYELVKLLAGMRADVAFVEQVGGIPGQSASAAFNFGRAAGAVEYQLKGLGVPVTMVPPGTWKKGLRVNPGKDGARAMAAQLWPLMSNMFRRVKDADRAEAALIAEWGRRQHESVVNVFS